MPQPDLILWNIECGFGIFVLLLFLQIAHWSHQAKRPSYELMTDEDLRVIEKLNAREKLSKDERLVLAERRISQLLKEIAELKEKLANSAIENNQLKQENKHQDELANTKRDLEQARAGPKAIPIPATAICAIAKREALYDREIITVGDGIRTFNFFQNTYSFTSFFELNNQLNNQPKQQGIDTNLYGHGGALPMGHSQLVEGISVVPDNRVSEADFNELVDKSSLSINIGQTPYVTFPLCRLLTRQADKIMADLRIEGKGITLTELENFNVIIKTAATLTEKCGLKVFLFGIRLAPLCG